MPDPTKNYQKNLNFTLRDEINKITSDLNSKWVEKNTAILVIHGIGHQNPLETLDAFGRGLVSALKKQYSFNNLELTHEVAKKTSNDGSVWFDNYIRISLPGNDFHIDLYEYYWAHLTEDKATIQDLQRWIKSTAQGARKFYKDNEELLLVYEANGNQGSIFLLANRDFQLWKYLFFLNFLVSVVPLMNGGFNFLLKAIRIVPYLGPFFSGWLEKKFLEALQNASNVVNDIVIYNTTDRKSRFYNIRRKILEGAVNSLRYLVEPKEKEGKHQLHYEQVMIAGHSLGSQVAFDAINHLTHLISKEEVKGYSKDGFLQNGSDKQLRIDSIVSGLVTFGSPLDKVAFFLREQVERKEYLRRQILTNYLCFKQRNWDLKKQSDEPKFKDPKPFAEIFKDMLWKNYYDSRDYVSGELDFYYPLTNIDCRFNSNPFSFTHGRYWEEEGMYKDIVHSFLNKQVR